MTDNDLHRALEAIGFTREANGGGTHIYRHGNTVASGFDGDLPSEHWFMIGVYADWQNDGESLIWSACDNTAEPAFGDEGPRDILADVAAALAIDANR